MHNAYFPTCSVFHFVPVYYHTKFSSIPPPFSNIQTSSADIDNLLKSISKLKSTRVCFIVFRYCTPREKGAYLFMVFIRYTKKSYKFLNECLHSNSDL